jgi:hypothetical protein
VLEADPLVTADQVTADLAFKARIDATGGDRDPMAEIAHHVRTLKGADAMQDKGAIEPRQLLGIFKSVFENSCAKESAFLSVHCKYIPAVRCGCDTPRI